MVKVSSKSNVKAVAGALAHVLREAETTEIHAVGAGAVNQAMKAIAIARGYLAPSGRDILCVPAFMRVQLNGKEQTGLRIIVRARDAHASL